MLCTNIGFMNAVDGIACEDETQFDSTDEDELALVWWDFCKDNGLITYTEIVEDGYQPDALG